MNTSPAVQVAGGVMDEAEPTELLASDAPDRETEALLTRVYLATLQHPEPSRSLLVAQGMPAAVIDRALATLVDQGLVRLHTGGVIEVVPPDISLPSLAL